MTPATADPGYDAYQAFLRSKVKIAETWGFECDDAEIHPMLKPHQRATVRWNVQGGRRADFLAFGLGKTFVQLETVRIVRGRAGGLALIVIPLGVKLEFIRDAEKLGIPVKFIRRIEEVGDEATIYLTNYETVRDGKLDPAAFTVASLDEASCLRGFGGTKTFREFMALFTGDAGPGKKRNGTSRVPYRFVATATPSPNDYIELLAYAAFLGIMDVSQAKTRFFKRDSTKADVLTLHPHKEKEFWLWVASWALFLQKPSDLGYSDDGYDLPEIDIRWHEVPTDHRSAGFDKSGQGKLLRDAALGVQDAATEKRDSLPARMARLIELRAADPDSHLLIWHDLEREREAIEATFPHTIYDRWHEVKDGNAAGLALYERHYSAYKYADGRERKLFCGPGEKTVLLTQRQDALFVWRKFVDDSGQQGINCAIFRNEGTDQSSDLIREAMSIAWLRWPGARLYTYVNPGKIRSTNPGCCFRRAGWTIAGETKGGLLVLEALPGIPVPDVTPRRGLATVYGSQSDDAKEAAITGFADGEIPALAGKPSMLGSGVNFQRHCAWAVFLGIGFKFNDLIQAIHRIYRFLQTRQVRIDLIFTEAERGVREILLRKWDAHNQQVARMQEIMKEYGLSQAALAQTLTRKLGVERVKVSGPGYELYNNDNVLECRGVRSNSVGLVLSSIPFSSQYEYSPNYADFGHSEGNAEFFQQMDFLTPELLRVLMPGRIAAIHVKDRIVPGGLTGLTFQTVYPFHVDCIQHYVKHGFAYMGMVTIVTDVVRENAQTYRLGWTEQCKDGTKMGVGMPEYLLLFRKPPSGEKSYADIPVRKLKGTEQVCTSCRQLFPAPNRKNPVLKECPQCAGPVIRSGQDAELGPRVYSRTDWQIDAHAFHRSSGNRHLTPEELRGLTHKEIFRLFRDHSMSEVYDLTHHVQIGEALEEEGKLPTDFMLLQPQSWSDEVWTDITRMLTLNNAQSSKGKESHLCPMQFDLADRVIERFSMPGEIVLDPFGGLMTVPYRAILKKRRAIGMELSPSYFIDGCNYCRAAAEEISMPSLFDLDPESEVAA